MDTSIAATELVSVLWTYPVRAGYVATWLSQSLQTRRLHCRSLSRMLPAKTLHCRRPKHC